MVEYLEKNMCIENYVYQETRQLLNSGKSIKYKKDNVIILQDAFILLDSE